LKQFDVYLRQKVTELDLYLKELLIRHDMGARSNMILRSSGIYLLIGKFLTPSRHEAILKTSVQPTHAEAFGGALAEMTLKSSVTAHLGLLASELQDEMILNQGEFSLASEEFNGGRDRLVLGSSDVSGELWTIIKGSSKSILHSNLGVGWHVDKYPSISHGSVLAVILSEAAILYVYGMEARARLDSALNVALTRYRLLNEMDELGLEDFDSMTLEDVDFISLE
jgi:hypothetical protein